MPVKHVPCTKCPFAETRVWYMRCEFALTDGESGCDFTEKELASIKAELARDEALQFNRRRWKD